MDANARSGEWKWLGSSGSESDDVYLSADQLKVPILCGPCDKKLGGKLDKPAKEWCERILSGNQKIDNPEMLACFISSIFWRASLSTHSAFDHMNLSRRDEERLRQATYDPKKAFKFASFNVSKMVFPSGRVQDINMLSFIGTMKRLRQPNDDGRPYLELIAFMGGHLWKAILPPLECKFEATYRAISADDKVIKVDRYDFENDPDIRDYVETLRKKNDRGNLTGAAKKYLER